MKKTFTSILNFLDRNFSLSKRQVFITVIILLIIGLGMRCGYGMMRERPPRDEKFYIETVKEINANDNFHKNKYNLGPLMPQLAAFLCRTGLPAETALRTLNLSYAMLWVLAMFFLCRDVFDDNKAGLLGMAFATFNPYSIRMASQILREPLYILLFTLSLWCTVRVIKSRGGNLLYPVAIGILAILGFCTRIEGFEIILFLPIALIIILVQYKKQYLKQCIYGLTVFSLTVGVLVAALLCFKDDYISRLNDNVIGYYKLFTSSRIE